VLARTIAVILLFGSSVRLEPDAARTYTRTATIVDGVYEGEYRSWYANGRPHEIRHYVHGHEEGLQQAWSENGTLYINYEARDGRHYGMENSTPCVAPDPGGDRDPRKAGLPFFEDRSFTPRWQPVEHRVADFSLTTQAGKVVGAHDLDGYIYVASFVYTKCAAVCPLLVRQLARVQAAMRTRPDVRIVSFSVTPETDTPAVLASFGRDRGIDAARWWLLTGDRNQIYSLARQSYFADDDRTGDFLHTEKVLLVDRAGHLRGVYNGTQPFQVDQLVKDIGKIALD